MKSVKYLMVASTLGVGLALAVSACGGSDSTTTVTQSGSAPTQTTTPTTAPTTTTPTSTTSSATTTPTTTTTAAGPSACGANQAFSQVSHTCVDVGSGNNPCPKGQVPMADRPVCVKE